MNHKWRAFWRGFRRGVSLDFAPRPTRINVRFRHDSKEEACGHAVRTKSVHSPFACLRTSGHEGDHIAVMAAAARADGVCHSCRNKCGEEHKFDCLFGLGERLCQEFFTRFPKVGRMEWDGEELILYRPESLEPLVDSDFDIGSPIREAIEELKSAFEPVPGFLAFSKKPK